MKSTIEYAAIEVTGTYPYPEALVYEDQLLTENGLLKKKLEKMSKRIAELEKRLPNESVIVLRDITREQAKGEIVQLYKTGRTLYCSDIVKELGIELRTVAEICDELENNGELVIDQKIQSNR